ncbi:putative splicing factor; arginine/serine-rich 1 [Paratrimastix pyriformis]|uniref:Splicing factor n=1 Tax=Paratrimastix pyriformis TaxID=342808 RepID=A0ABQ8USE9_9EUKA|nr:putative splicing factor; arginine/serine-rich 1 [Paratrimastix pyriformis]
MGRSNTLFVANLPSDTERQEILPFFERYGKVVRCDLPPPRSGRSMRIAFVEFESSHDAEDALRGLQGYRFHGSSFSIDYAKLAPSAAWRHSPPPRRDDGNKRFRSPEVSFASWPFTAPVSVASPPLAARSVAPPVAAIPPVALASPPVARVPVPAPVAALATVSVAPLPAFPFALRPAVAISRCPSPVAPAAHQPVAHRPARPREETVALAPRQEHRQLRAAPTALRATCRTRRCNL